MARHRFPPPCLRDDALARDVLREANFVLSILGVRVKGLRTTAKKVLQDVKDAIAADDRFAKAFEPSVDGLQ